MPTSIRSTLSRREIFQKCMALGTFAVASSYPVNAMIAAFEEREGQARQPTPPNEIGPFYKKRAPETTNLRMAGDPGMPLAVSGQVFNTRGDPVTNAVVEIWQTDHLGHYDLDGYRYRAKLATDRSGGYKFDSVMPGHYPDRVCQHVHYLATAPGHKPLITQLYFATDPVFEGDPDHNFARDPILHSRELIRPVMLTGDPHDIQAAVRFELCMERL
jgi:protocatechuate 3,4-dioxygenase beta subunit